MWQFILKSVLLVVCTLGVSINTWAIQLDYQAQDIRRKVNLYINAQAPVLSNWIKHNQDDADLAFQALSIHYNNIGTDISNQSGELLTIDFFVKIGQLEKNGAQVNDQKPHFRELYFSPSTGTEQIPPEALAITSLVSVHYNPSRHEGLIDKNQPTPNERVEEISISTDDVLNRVTNLISTTSQSLHSFTQSRKNSEELTQTVLALSKTIELPNNINLKKDFYAADNPENAQRREQAESFVAALLIAHLTNVSIDQAKSTGRPTLTYNPKDLPIDINELASLLKTGCQSDTVIFKIIVANDAEQNVNQNVATDDAAAKLSQLQDRLAQLESKADKLHRNAMGGVASVIAAAGLSQPYQPGTNMVGASLGTYSGQSALALGTSYISHSGQWVFKLSGTVNERSKLGANTGVGYQW